MRGMSPRALPCLLPALLVVATASARQPAATVDTWSTQRLSLRGQPHLLSHSQVNPARPAATGLPAMQPLLARELAGHRLEVQVASTLGSDWSTALPVLQPEADRALRWLARLSPDDRRPRRLAMHLVDRGQRYELQHAHPAAHAVQLTYLMPVDAAPPSRSIALAQGLALGLHEASHALRPQAARDRGDDEYRASLLAACYLIDGLQPGDRMRLQAPPAGRGDFTVRHSEGARSRAIADLVQVAGGDRLDGADLARKATLLGHCQRRLAQPPR